jgi:hypothetical protein
VSSISPELPGSRSEPYSVEFFELQLRFAERVADLSGVPFVEAVGCYTNLYVRLAMGQRLDASNADWQRYLAGLLASPEQAAWTQSIHLQRLHLRSGSTSAWTEGCFSYAIAGLDCVRLHFHAATAEAPLSAGSCQDRLSELADLFAHLKAFSSDGMQVIGASWLYNLDCYRRLFPERYLSSLHTIDHPYQRMPLWGQFLRRDRTVRPEVGPRFLAQVAKAERLSDLARCFPLGVLTTRAPASWFYEHLGL